MQPGDSERFHRRRFLKRSLGASVLLAGALSSSRSLSPARPARTNSLRVAVIGVRAVAATT